LYVYLKQSRMKAIVFMLLFYMSISDTIQLPVRNPIIGEALLSYPANDTIKRPVVQLQETSIDSMNLVVIRDTANNSAELNVRLGKAYGELFTFINQNNLLHGKVMAFYYTSKWPFVFEAALQTDRLAYCTSGRVKINRLPAGNAVVAKYTGPYGHVSIAYAAIAGWMAAHNKTANGYPFEVYINDPAQVRDSFELRTDVYQMMKK